MARKHLLTDLAEKKLAAVNLSQGALTADVQAPQAPKYLSKAGTKRAIGAVSRSFEKIKAQGVIDLDPDLIDPPLVKDRLGLDPVVFAHFVEQIKESGQLVPILVRPHPTDEGRYQTAYGWRRTQAAKAIGVKVRSVIKMLTDKEMIVAQGQENNEREDLSFIEKAVYAASLERNGFGRDVIMRALAIDKTTCSRLISATAKIPQEVIEVIGSAPKIGRDKWTEMAQCIVAPNARAKIADMMGEEAFLNKTSDERFGAVLKALKSKKQKSPRVRIWTDADGKKIVKYKQDTKALTLVVDQKSAPDFGDFLIESLPELYATYKRRLED